MHKTSQFLTSFRAVEIALALFTIYRIIEIAIFFSTVFPAEGALNFAGSILFSVVFGSLLTIINTNKQYLKKDKYEEGNFLTFFVILFNFSMHIFFWIIWDKTKDNLTLHLHSIANVNDGFKLLLCIALSSVEFNLNRIFINRWEIRKTELKIMKELPILNKEKEKLEFEINKRIRENDRSVCLYCLSSWPSAQAASGHMNKCEKKNEFLTAYREEISN